MAGNSKQQPTQRVKMKIKKGDTVQIIAGNDKGATGRVIRVMPDDNKIVVEGVNVRKKHQKARQAGRQQVQGGIVQFEAPIHASNAMLIDPVSGKPTRVTIKRDAEGKRVRVARKSGEELP